MNRYTSLADLPAEILESRVQVDDNELRLAYDMATRNEVVKSATNIVLRGMGVEDLELNVGGMKYAPKVHNVIVQRYWRSFARSMWLYNHMFGFMPWIKGCVEEDCSVDEDWMEKNSEVRKRLAAEGDTMIRDSTRPFLDQFDIPIIPTFGSYSVHTWCDKNTMQTRLICLPNMDLSGTAQPIQVLLFDDMNLPVALDGRAPLRSPLASLIEPYARLGQFKLFATTAAFALARPITFVEIDHKDLDLKDAYPKREYGDGVLNDIADTKTWIDTSGSAFAMSTEIAAHFKKQQAALAASTSWSSDPSRTFTYAAQDAIVQLPLTYRVGAQPPQPQAPTCLPEMSREFIESVARIFDIPFARLTSASGSAAKVATPDDLVNFENSNASETRALLLKMDEVLHFLYPEASHTAVFSLRAPQHRDPTIEETLALLDHDVISPREARGLARQKHSHVSAVPHTPLPDIAEALSLMEHDIISREEARDLARTKHPGLGTKLPEPKAEALNLMEHEVLTKPQVREKKKRKHT